MKKERATQGKDRLQNSLRKSVFFMIHAACLLAIWTGISWAAALVCLALYLIRMFAITAGFHRYFSHRSYKTSRVFHFILGWIGTAAAQKGPIWWASHHRHHHQHSDQEDDVHSPVMETIWWAHVGWVLSSQFVKPRPELVRDLEQFPEIKFLDRYDLLPPVILAVTVYLLGVFCEVYFPSLNTSGAQMLIWGFFISTVLLYHGTFLVNSAAHLIGTQRFNTGDQSRNSWLVALFTLGEGWHNNHHRYPGSVRQGFYWWELDISHLALKFLSWFGIVWDLRSPPARIYEEAGQQPAR